MIGDEGAKLIADSLQQNTTLTRLDIPSNILTSYTHVKVNSIGQKGVDYLKHALSKNKTLKELALYGIASHTLLI